MKRFAALMAASHAAAAMDVRTAWQTIQEASRYDEPLRRRIEGITWMVWGLVTVAIFLSYDALSPHFHSFDHETGTETLAPWYIDGLWVYWVAAGALLTWVLWRTVALAARVGPPQAGLRVTAAWIAAGAVGWALVLAVAPWLHPHLTPAVAIGLAWLMLGVVNIQRATPMGRRVLAVVGFAILAGTLALQPLAPPPGGDLFALNTGRFLAVGLPPFLAGAWQSLRG